MTTKNEPSRQVVNPAAEKARKRAEVVTTLRALYAERDAVGRSYAEASRRAGGNPTLRARLDWLDGVIEAHRFELDEVDR